MTTSIKKRRIKEAINKWEQVIRNIRNRQSLEEKRRKTCKQKFIS